LLHRLQADAPAPSVEALLHAFLPDRFIAHTHADAILALTNRSNGRDLVCQVLGQEVLVVDYEMSGLPLARKVADARENNPGADTLVVLHHGIFTFGDTAAAALDRMQERVTRARKWLAASQPKKPVPAIAQPALSDLARVVQIFRGCCRPQRTAGRAALPLLVETRSTPDLIEISLSPEAPAWCDSGVLTPDHVIRTKNQYVYIDQVPDEDQALADLINEKIERYRQRYRRYLAAHGDEQKAASLDLLPRIFLVAGLGLAALGATPREARVAADIAEHTLRVKRLCGAAAYQPISENHVHDMEYWPLQRQKVKPQHSQPLTGRIALVTGAAGAIGYGIADRLLAAGAVVAVSDIDPAGLEKVRTLLAEKYGSERVTPVIFDVTDFSAAVRGLEEVILAFGGLDLVVPNAGTAHVATLEELDPDKFQKVLSVNLMGCFNVIKAAVPCFRRQAGGGDIVVISSKNVFDPGAAFGAYSASKAAAHQVARIAALELAGLGVRVNMVNPDAVFGDENVPSKLWAMIGPDRMKARGLDPDGLKEYYRQRNLLKVSVYAEHVGNAVVFFASGLTPTTGATLPVDGGVAAAFPR
ncbi:MAG: bifunctional aldolase/short-chain dehydrogenase, partial [Desulfosudaceae bacterium]